MREGPVSDRGSRGQGTSDSGMERCSVDVHSKLQQQRQENKLIN